MLPNGYQFDHCFFSNRTHLLSHSIHRDNREPKTPPQFQQLGELTHHQRNKGFSIMSVSLRQHLLGCLVQFRQFPFSATQPLISWCPSFMVSVLSFLCIIPDLLPHCNRFCQLTPRALSPSRSHSLGFPVFFAKFCLRSTIPKFWERRRTNFSDVCLLFSPCFRPASPCFRPASPCFRPASVFSPRFHPVFCFHPVFTLSPNTVPLYLSLSMPLCVPSGVSTPLSPPHVSPSSQPPLWALFFDNSTAR